MAPVEVVQGDLPLILSFPHTGTYLPTEVAERLNANGRLLADTDWHVHRLYDGLLEGVTTVRATFHRYVIDANRDPGGASLYPGQNTTGLIPETDFDGQPIWQAGREPQAADIAAMLRDFHTPYHAALNTEIERVSTRHGFAVLYDCHSIRSTIPYLFEGRLPDLNIGTVDGASCDPHLEAKVAELASGAAGYTAVLNGRFKGGWTTRHRGRPVEGVHAIQMELAQSTYLKAEAPPFAFDPVRAELLRQPLHAILTALVELAPQLPLIPRTPS
jgi:formiminoglutamase